MPKLARRWCSRCNAVHGSDCPSRPAWEKPARAKPGRGGRPWRRKRQRIFERDGYLCQLHLERGQEVVVTLHGRSAGVCDHIIHLAEGGTDADHNLQTICQDCDKEKTQRESQRGRVGPKP